MSWDDFMLDAMNLVAVLVLVLLNGFFVAAELALVRVRDTQLDMLVAKGNRRAKTARHLIGHLDAYIGATQFGITLASLALGIAIEPVFQQVLGPVFRWLAISSLETQRHLAIGIGFFVNCYLLIVAGELAPKVIAIRRTMDTALWVASPLQWFYRLSYPFIWLLNHSAQWILRRLGIVADELHAHRSEDELRLMLSSARLAPGGTAFRRDLLLNALDLRQRIARDVMRPRQEITVFDTESSIADCLEVAEKSRYSRFPLCEAGDPDKTVGVVHIKDLYSLRAKAVTAAELRPVARKLIYVPETARLEKLLQLFLERKLHLALVVDEYGGTLGMVTLENILEELVGQIQDEFDQEVPLLTRVNDTTWEVAGALALHELEQVVGVSLAADGITTTSGWITRRLGGFPKVGDVLKINGFELRVEELANLRVARLQVVRPAAAAGGETH